MNKLFEMNKRESAVDIVVNSVKQLLIQRKLKPGDRLPSELEISEGLGVSRGSVREAMKILSAFGLVDVRVGNGTYICDSVNNGMMDSVLFSFLISNPDMENIYEFRQSIEQDVLELVIKHYHKNERERLNLKENLMELENLIKTGAKQDVIGENDIRFHYILGSATHNILMERIYKFVIDFMSSSIKSTHKKQNGEVAYQTHKAIMDILEYKNSEQIKEVVDRCVKTWSELQDK